MFPRFNMACDGGWGIVESVQCQTTIRVVDPQDSIGQQLGSQQRHFSIVRDHLRGDRCAEPIQVADIRFERDLAAVGQDRVGRRDLPTTLFLDPIPLAGMVKQIGQLNPGPPQAVFLTTPSRSSGW